MLRSRWNFLKCLSAVLFYRSLRVMLDVVCCDQDNPHPSTKVHGMLWDYQPEGIMKRIVEIAGRNPSGSSFIVFQGLRENLAVAGECALNSHINSFARCSFRNY